MTSQASPRHRSDEGDQPGHQEDVERPPQPDQAGVLREHQQRERHEADQRHDPGPGQVAVVAGADEHAVQREDDAADRLGDRRDDQHRREQGPDGGVVGEQRDERRAQRDQHDAEDAHRTRSPTAPSGGSTPGCPSTSPAPR